MTTYNTGNPIGSTDARDLYDNAQNLDNFANGTSASYSDRLGVTRRSLAGIEATADGVLNGIGYAVPVAYASGISMTLTSQTVDYNGVIYAPKSSALPFTTSSWGADSVKFRAVQVTDADLITYTPAGTGAVDTTVQSKLRETVSVKDFGAVGDGVTDDKNALQNAFDWSKSTGRPVFLEDNRYYTSGTLDAGGAIIRSLSNKPGGADPLSLRKPDGTYVFGLFDYTWFYNTGHGTYTWAQMIADTAYGCCIVSDYNGPILYCQEGVYERFDISGVAIVGYQNRTLQDGLATAAATVYAGAGQKINNVSVIGCGRHGINLRRGFEVSVFSNNILTANNGYGLKVEKQPGVDCPVEYLDFENCQFLSNRLGGVYLDHWRKHILFDYCQLQNSGQYNSTGGIDPVLGYDRTVPLTTAAMAAGIWVNNVSLDIGAGFGYTFEMRQCFGEEVAVGLHLRGRNGGGVVRDLKLTENTFIRASSVATSVAGGGENGAAFYIDVNYADSWYSLGNYKQALQGIVFASVPSRDPGNKIFLYDDGVPESTTAEKNFQDFNLPGDISAGLDISAGNSMSAANVLSAGNEFNVGTYSGTGASAGVKTDQFGGVFTRLSSATTAGGVNHQAFVNPNGIVGSISTSGSGTSFNISSDYRLKENVVPILDAIEKVKLLKPSRFNFKVDQETIVDGFIAHEVQEVVPQAVIGEKDGVREDGSMKIQQIDQSKLIPLLTAALQICISRIEALEAKSI